MTQNHHVGVDQSEGIDNNLKTTGATHETSLPNSVISDSQLITDFVQCA